MKHPHLLLAALIAGTVSFSAAAAPAAKAPAGKPATTKPAAAPAEEEEKSGSGGVVSSSGGDLRPGEKPLSRDEYYACLVERRDNDKETRAHNKASAEFEKRLAAFQKEAGEIRVIDQAIEAKVAEFNKRSETLAASIKAFNEASKKERDEEAAKQLKAQQDSLNREIGEWKAQVQAGSAETDARKKAHNDQVPQFNEERNRLNTASASIQKRADELSARCDDKPVNEGDYFAAQRRLKRADAAAAAAAAASAAPAAASAPAPVAAEPAKAKPGKKKK